MNSDQIICIDDKFPQEFIELYEKFNVVTPKEGKLYTIRKVIKTLNGVGVLLNELLNPDVPIIHPMGRTKGTAEPSWNIHRFCNLDQTAISEEESKELMRNQKREKQLVKPLDKNNPYNN